MLSATCPKCSNLHTVTTIDDFKSHYIANHHCPMCDHNWDSKHRISEWLPGMSRFSIRTRQYKEDELVTRMYDAAADSIQTDIFKKGETLVVQDPPTQTNVTLRWVDLLPPGPGIISGLNKQETPRIVGAESFGF